jgi:hypothetical protein
MNGADTIGKKRAGPVPKAPGKKSITDPVFGAGPKQATLNFMKKS